MSQGLQPYVISEQKTGLYSYLQPWVRPIDAWEPLTNAYVYRGQICKRNGYTVFGTCADKAPVMGIMQWINESNPSDNTLVVCTSKNAYYGLSLTPITAVSLSPFFVGTVTGTMTISLLFGNLSGTTTVTAYNASMVLQDTMTATGTGAFSGGGTVFTAASSSVVYATGAVIIASIGTNVGYTLKVSTTSTNYFTGDNTNFFNWTNWQPTDPATSLPSLSYLYVTNNVDPVTLITFSGMGTPSLSRPFFYTTSDGSQYINKALDVKVFKNRLLLVRPSLQQTGTSTVQVSNQGVFYSAQFNPFNFNTIPGAGGFIIAATGDVIQSTEFLRDAIITFFANSTWILRFTGNQTQPFRFDIINVTRTTRAPYGTIAYDEQVTSIGNRGLIFCDGTYVDRYDISIIDYYSDEISQQWMSQSFGQRYDNVNQSWMLYVMQTNTLVPPTFTAPNSNACIVFNYLEKTFATYTFPDSIAEEGDYTRVPTLMTCMGVWNLTSGDTWDDLTQTWDSADFAWLQPGDETEVPILLMGDAYGNVYRMDDADVSVDQQLAINGMGAYQFFDAPIKEEITSTRWNPIISSAQKLQIPYIDIYYKIVSNHGESIQAKLLFSVDNSSLPAQEPVLTLDGPTGNDYTWKRIYCNLVGQFIQMKIQMMDDGPLVINGIILWVLPAGRLTA